MLWSRGPNIFVESRLADTDPGVGIDLASGEGRNAIWLAENGWEMTAVDFSRVAIDRGRKMSDQVEFVAADVFEWEPTWGGEVLGESSRPSTSKSRGYDLVLIAYLQVEAGRLRSLVEKAAEWLGPGGELFLIGHDVSNIADGVGGPQVPGILWDVDLILEWIRSLDLVEGGVVERPVEVDGDIRYARDTLVRAKARATDQ